MCTRDNTKLPVISKAAFDEDDGNDDDGTWCYCKEAKGGSMIGCENPSCSIKWFHMTCLRMRENPRVNGFVPLVTYPTAKNVQDYIPYSGKVWRAECLANLLFLSVWRKKVWRMNGSAKGLSMVGINLDGFSLANRLRFAKFAKLSPHQTFSLYST